MLHVYNITALLTCMYLLVESRNRSWNKSWWTVVKHLAALWIVRNYNTTTTRHVCNNNNNNNNNRLLNTILCLSEICFTYVF